MGIEDGLWATAEDQSAALSLVYRAKGLAPWSDRAWRGVDDTVLQVLVCTNWLPVIKLVAKSSKGNHQ